ncbi:uncharacterized protein LOC114931116 [Nylanderia fulva]|uniref:uncharacterized protein LOC114931116 n=1 Tax=Nylanderia fulva TaxID=613905 RepID=UPI0010FBACAB|nr:uncharacterized protein LOC114931116 [Nylanderia fulva]
MVHQLILLCMLSPAIFGQLHKTKDPNDEPFLPIHPVYPYSPKLIKRGIETESTSQLTPELYAPKVDAKDSYSSSYSNNDQRDSSYDSYPKNNSPTSVYPPYSNNAYTYTNIPYVFYNPYSTQYAVNPASYSSPSYPNYYYQPSYYYPHYFNHASLSPSPSSLSGVDYRETTSQDSTEAAETDKQNKDKQGVQPKENETNQDASTSQFVDGGNYISGNLRDLDGQSSTYKIASPYNQLDGQAKGLPIPLPRTTYRVISVGGQPVGPDYPLPESYVKVQQMELMSQTLANLLAQKQADQSYENNRDVLSSVNDGSYANQDVYSQTTPSYMSLLGPRTKTGVTYVINVDGTAKTNGGHTNLRDSALQKTSNKDTRYSSVRYVQRPMLQTYTSSDIRGKHRDHVINGRPTKQRDEYSNYGSIYGQSSNKQEQSYRNYQNPSSSYQNKDFAVTSQTPRVYNYEYSAYESGQTQQTQDKISPNNGNFGAKKIQ